MPASNVARIGFAVQSARGAAAVEPQYWMNLTGGGMRPTPETEQRSETGLGRDVGATFIRVLSAAGDPGFLLRPATAGLIYWTVLGAKASAAYPTALWTTVSGQAVTLGSAYRTAAGRVMEVTTAGNAGTVEPVGTTVGQQVAGSGGTGPFATYTVRSLTALTKHTFTPANDQPYLTVWKELGDSIFERFTDCKMTAANLEFAAGGDLALSTTLMGLDFARLTSTPAPGASVHDQAVPFRVPGATYTVDGATDDAIASGNFNIEAGQNPVQTNKSTYSYIEPGQRTISFAYERVYTDIAAYAKVYYGGPAGTSPSLDVWPGTIQLQFGPNSGPYIKYTIQRALFTEAGSDPDPGGAPMMLSTVGAADRPPTGNIAEVEVVNDVAAYNAAA